MDTKLLDILACPVCKGPLQLSEDKTELISKVLGSHVQRLATIAHGDGVCTTCIPQPLAGPLKTPATTER